MTVMATAVSFPTTRADIAGVSVADLASRFGTPLYVYDAAKIVQRINDLRQFDVIRFAQKANSNLSILGLMREHGVVVDAVSAGEVHRALAAKYEIQGEPPPVVFCADIFDRDSLRMVVEQNIFTNLGSPDMIDQLGEQAPGRNVSLRINPGFGHGHSQKTNTGGEQSKHGIWHEDIDDCLVRADRYGLTVTGLHMHIGSGTDLEHLGQVCSAMERIARTVGRTVTTISAGGGLPIAYSEGQSVVDLESYFQLWDETRQRLQQEFGHKVSLEIEPGRYLVAESGYLVAEIRAIKQMGGNTFYLLDAGFNNLARPILYGAHHPMSIATSDSTRRHHDVVVGGPLCESGDIFTQTEGGFVCKRSLPMASVGEHLVIECAGAYGFVMGSNYNSQPFPAEVLIDDQQPRLIRARQSHQDLFRDEIVSG